MAAQCQPLVKEFFSKVNLMNFAPKMTPDLLLLSHRGYRQKFEVLALRLALEENFSLVVIKVTWWNVTKNCTRISARILFFQKNIQSSLTFSSINYLSHINSPTSILPYLLLMRFDLASASSRYMEPNTSLLLRGIRSQIQAWYKISR